MYAFLNFPTTFGSAVVRDIAPALLGCTLWGTVSYQWFRWMRHDASHTPSRKRTLILFSTLSLAVAVLGYICTIVRACVMTTSVPSYTWLVLSTLVFLWVVISLSLGIWFLQQPPSAVVKHRRAANALTAASATGMWLSAFAIVYILVDAVRVWCVPRNLPPTHPRKLAWLNVTKDLMDYEAPGPEWSTALHYWRTQVPNDVREAHEDSIRKILTKPTRLN